VQENFSQTIIFNLVVFNNDALSSVLNKVLGLFTAVHYTAYSNKLVYLELSVPSIKEQYLRARQVAYSKSGVR